MQPSFAESMVEHMQPLHRTHRAHSRWHTAVCTLLAFLLGYTVQECFPIGKSSRRLQEDLASTWLGTVGRGAAAMAVAQGGAPKRTEPITCTRAGAAPALHLGGWTNLTEPNCVPMPPRAASCIVNFGSRWEWDALQCGARPFSLEDLRTMLRGKRVAMVGDSHARYMFFWLDIVLKAELVQRAEEMVKFWHDVTSQTAGVNLEYYAKYNPKENAAVIRSLMVSEKLPDVGIISTGAWYAVPEWDWQHFGEHLKELEAAVREAKQKRPDTLWLIMTIPPRAEKRKYSSTWKCDNTRIPPLNDDLRNSPLISEGLAVLLDNHQLTRDCVHWCSLDADHANSLVYYTMIQIWANLLQLPEKK